MEAGVRGSLGGLRHDPFSSLPMRLPHRDLAAGDHFGFLGLTALANRVVASTTLGFFGCLGLRTSRPPLFFTDIAHSSTAGMRPGVLQAAVSVKARHYAQIRASASTR
jgi:hypothetical protein